ncbi:hypothetical protein ACVWWO_000100 [Bradyrhizobium sp. F1.13.1]
MRYQLALLHCRPWTLNGISGRLIESHYENNYGGTLNRLNAISEEIERLDLGTAPGPSLARLKRDEIVALNSTLLHELYFASRGGDGRVVPDDLASAIAKDFGSVDRWRQAGPGSPAWIAGVRRHRVRTGRWLGLGVADLCSARRTAHQSDRVRNTVKASRAASRSSPSICMSPLSTWNSAPRPAPTSPPSCATSINPT